jgi:hypothetical protein
MTNPPPTPDKAVADAATTWLRVLIGAFVRDSTPAEAAAALRSATAAVASWEFVASLLRVHRCAGIAYHLLSLPEVRAACTPPAETMNWLRSAYQAAFVQTVLEPPIVRRHVDALAAAGVPALVIKGLAVGAWLYGDPALREHTDVDLLVPEAQADTVRAVLTGAGYQWMSGPYDYPNPFEGPPLDPHESLGTMSFWHPKGDPPLDLSFDPLRRFWRPPAREREPFAGWWTRRQTVTVSGIEFSTLGPEDQFLQLGRHLQFHDYSRDGWFVDILLLLNRHGERLDWDLIGCEAQSHGIAAGLYRTLELADRVFGLRAPASAWHALRPDPIRRSVHRLIWPDDQVQSRTRRQDTSNPLSPRMLNPRGRRQALGLALLVLDRERRRNLTYLLRRALPPRSWLRQVYGDPTAGAPSYLALLRIHRREVTRLRRSA